MTRHYNPTIAQNASRILNSKTSDFISDEVSNLVAVLPIDSVCNIVRSNVRATSGSSTVFATPTDKDFYLVAANLSLSADAACDNTNCVMNVTIDGVLSNRDIIRIQKLSLTAINDTVSLHLTKPLKIDRGTNITINSTFTVGNAIFGGCIIGYTEEVTK